MRVRHLTIERFRGLRALTFAPGPRTVILGPNNAGKSTVLEGLDLLLHAGLGRQRPQPTEIDYFARRPEAGFVIEAILGELPSAYVAEVRRHLEGWKAATEELVAEPDGEDVEPVVRVRVRGTEDFDLFHEFAKEESDGARFSPGLRAKVGWVFDGRARDPSRQLAFYQGGLLERLFGDVDLKPAVDALKAALEGGASAVNADTGIEGKLASLAKDLRLLGLLAPEELPQFEAGAISLRELLQSLRLTMPGGEVQVPVARQGRGAQRLLLVAILLRLAEASGQPAIGGFEEPEEALEPLRQTQVARMLTGISERGGQVFVVTHSPEIARAFLIDDFLLLDERAGGAGARLLRTTVSEPVRQKYERWLDRSVVRALFARIPVLVEGPGDRAVLETFWRALATPPAASEADPEPEALIRPPEQAGVDILNCEGASNMPMMARLLKEAGKTVVAWVEQDVPEEVARLRGEGHCDAFIGHDPQHGRQNLEQALAQTASIPALLAGLDELASSRGYSWETQRGYLVSVVGEIDDSKREQMKAAEALADLFGALEEAAARLLIAKALSGKEVAPFEMKGARQGRIVAEAILATDGVVPEPFERALREFDSWIAAGCTPIGEISMAG